MANSEFPWFRFYARDWLTDSNVMLMPCIARGAYIHLLAFQWENRGIPGDPADVARLVGVPVEVFTDEVWPHLEELFPESKHSLGSAYASLPRCNERLESERSEKVAERERKVAGGRVGGHKSRKRSVLDKVSIPKGKLKHTLSTPQASSDADADEEPPTPTSGGPEIPVGDSGGRTGSRADGTNPRALAVAEEAHARKNDERRRLELIRKIDPGGAIRGTYRGGKGFRLWNDIGLPELQSFAKQSGLDQSATLPGLRKAPVSTKQGHESTRDVQT